MAKITIADLDIHYVGEGAGEVLLILPENAHSSLAYRGGYAAPDFVLNSIHCPVLLSGSLQDATTPGIAGEFARISSLVPDCSLYLASESGHRYGDEHPLLWTAPEVFRAAAGLFLGRA